MMRAIVGRNFGLLLALAIPTVFSNAMVGQNGFLTAALIGGTLYDTARGMPTVATFDHLIAAAKVSR